MYLSCVIRGEGSPTVLRVSGGRRTKASRPSANRELGGEPSSGPGPSTPLLGQTTCRAAASLTRGRDHRVAFVHAIETFVGFRKEPIVFRREVRGVDLRYGNTTPKRAMRIDDRAVAILRTGLSLPQVGIKLVLDSTAPKILLELVTVQSMSDVRCLLVTCSATVRCGVDLSLLGRARHRRPAGTQTDCTGKEELCEFHENALPSRGP